MWRTAGSTALSEEVEGGIPEELADLPGISRESAMKVGEMSVKWRAKQCLKVFLIGLPNPF